MLIVGKLTPIDTLASIVIFWPCRRLHGPLLFKLFAPQSGQADQTNAEQENAGGLRNGEEVRDCIHRFSSGKCRNNDKPEYKNEWEYGYSYVFFFHISPQTTLAFMVYFAMKTGVV
jgi:hypothetical protein